MIHGGNNANRDYKVELSKIRLDDGQCTHCPPHRVENEGNRDGRWIKGPNGQPHGKFLPSKTKEMK